MNKLTISYAKILEGFSQHESQYQNKQNFGEYHRYFLALLRGEPTEDKANAVVGVSMQKDATQKDVTQKDSAHKEESAHKARMAFLARAAQAVATELQGLSEAQKNNLHSLAVRFDAETFDDMFYVPEGATEASARGKLWSIFCSEAETLATQSNAQIVAHADECISAIRNRRVVSIEALNETPIVDASREILFTSNILLTLPLTKDENELQALKLPPAIMKSLHDIMKEPQLYWYDHPMPIGVPLEANEMIYGIQGLADMLAYEKSHGTVAQDAELEVLLSVSVTHVGLSDIAHDYLRFELDRAGKFEGLKIYIVTERDTQAMAAELEALDSGTPLHTDAKTSPLPSQTQAQTQASQTQASPSQTQAQAQEEEPAQIQEVFGVDGRYGRHYSFLKAVAPLWSRVMNRKTKATFKIDLDQVFPQEVMHKETGKTAFEHFCTPLWGARAKDSRGEPIELGMIAGALVNEADIHKGLFTPDVNVPQEPLSAIDILFPRVLMMALSTRAEMMTVYDNAHSNLDGTHTALQRVHVTGGTNGILIDALMTHRPFTPTFIGRAEDQSYLMSVFNASNDARRTAGLRYVHASGLIMRHDKAAFAGEAIKAAKFGTYAADLLRTILFSRYAKILPGGLDSFKQEFSPFTSCFSTDTPILAAISRLMLHCLALDEEGTAAQLDVAIQSIDAELNAVERTQWLAQQYLREKTLWHRYYDRLALLADMPDDAAAVRALARLLESCRVR